MSKEDKKVQKSRNFAFVLYEDSCTPNWQEKLANLYSPVYYILHNCDANPDGTLKKPHYHILLAFENPRSIKSVERFCEEIGAANGVVQQVQCLKGYARYLCHLDNPDKHLYSQEDVICIGGADYSTMINTESDKLSQVSDIIAFINEHGIFVYADLIDYCLCENKVWFRILCSGYGKIIRDYIKSRYWAKHKYSYEM